MSNEHRSLDVLIQEMLDGAPDEDQRADLLKRVESDSEARKRYLDQVATHTALLAVLADCLPQKVGAPETLNSETPSTFVLKSRWPAIAVIGSLAATILLLLGSITYLGSREPKVVRSGSPPHPATITQAVGAYDRDGVAIRSGQILPPTSKDINYII